MGTGIGKDCQICEKQLNHDVGFNEEETMCSKCIEKIPKILKQLSESLQKLNEESNDK